MGFAYAGITELPTPRGTNCPPGWPAGWTCPGGPNPWPPGWPPTNGGTAPIQWPETWPWDDQEDDIEEYSSSYSIWIVAPSENEFVSDGQNFTLGAMVLDHTGAAITTYSGSDTITFSESGTSDGTLAFNNGTTITQSTDFGGLLDQVSYTINSGDTETFNIQASITISGTEYTDVVTFTAAKNYIDISSDDTSLIKNGATLPADTEDFTLTLTVKDSTDTTVTGYAGSVSLKWITDPQGSTPAGSNLYVYGVDGNSSYSDSTATAVAADQTGNTYAIPSALWASGTDGVVTIKCKFSSHFATGAENDTVVFRAEETA